MKLGAHCLADAVIDGLEFVSFKDQVDRFINAYLSVNPK